MQRSDHLKTFRVGWVLLALWASLLISCAHRLGATLPALVPETTGIYQPGKFVWFELLTENRDAVSKFYAELFGWTITDSADHRYYSNIVHHGKAIGGMVEVDDSDPSVKESRWICSISVDDVNAAAKKVTRLGGQVLYGPVDSGDRGRLAQVADSQGANFILLHALNGDPKKLAVAPGKPVWADLFTRNKAASAAFYNGLLGYQTVTSAEDTDHFYFAAGSKIRAGMTVVKWDDLESTWLPYIGVTDLRADVLKAIDLGGTLLAHTETAAVILDPGGAAIGLQLLPQGGEG